MTAGTGYGARMAAASTIGPWHSLALRGFARLPQRIRREAVRLIAPNHTAGALCFFDHDGRVLMLRQHHRQGWTLPGGLIDRGETAAQAVCREIREELGLTITVGTPLTTVVDPLTRRIDVIYYVPCESAFQVTPGSEATDAAWLRPDDAGDLDDPTAQAVAAFVMARQAGASTGRLDT
jgi:8-oxo-dGTP pyrophosphatase MutT (NUDIX family)